MSGEKVVSGPWGWVRPGFGRERVESSSVVGHRDVLFKGVNQSRSRLRCISMVWTRTHSKANT